MEGTLIQPPAPLAVPVMPRTLVIRPMEYKHPLGMPVYFSGVFGCDADSKGEMDVWVATFYDRNEAEAFVMASKTFGQQSIGVRLTIPLTKPEVASAGISSGAEAPVQD